VSDKGRAFIQAHLAEVIDKLTGYAPPEKNDEIATFMDWLFDDNILRSHGWVHEDDVVEGETIGAMCYNMPRDSIDKCPLKPQGRACVNCEHYTSARPATIKDLIGKEE
jgi:hypothetical protein